MSPLPATLSRVEAEAEADIDTRILQAEQRLIAREENLRRSATALGSQVREAVRPGRFLQPAVLTAAVAVIVLAWPSRKAAHAGASHHQPGAAPASVARPALFVLMAGLPWTRLLSHAWPLLPGRWRERFNPATAASILTFGLPLLEGWLTKRRRDEPARPG